MKRENSKFPRPRLLSVLLAVMAVFALIAGACADDNKESGSDDADAEESANDAESASSPSPGAPEVPEECGDTASETAAVEVAEARGAPDTALAEGVEVGTLEVIEEGDGDAVIPGGSVKALWSFVNPADGEVFQSTWDAGVGPQPLPLAELPESFSTAAAEMRVGGRYAIAVTVADVGGAPPELGLSDDDPVVFIMDIVSVSEDSAGLAEADPDALAAAEERGAPEMSVPEGDADTDQLVVIDEVEGEGAVVCPGDQVIAHYTGIRVEDGEQFDSSWDRGEPSEFGLDAVIQGWTEGLVGMKAGGRRTLVIPADLAYGDDEDSGRPAGTLVFTIDLVGVG
ncbi:MAG: FKBP-type peptidyl-prolyl cis-trans isomerase [Microthrixaceae bacterium]